MASEHYEITHQSQPLTIVRVGTDDYLFVKIPHTQQLAIQNPPNQSLQLAPTPIYPHHSPIADTRGTVEFTRNLLWIACGGLGLILAFLLLRPAPSPQPVIVQQPAPEKKRHTSKECQPAGLFGWGQVCESKEWWE